MAWVFPVVRPNAKRETRRHLGAVTTLGMFQKEAEKPAANVRALGKHIPPNRQIDSLLDAAVSSSESGAKLAQLYLERAYSLLREDYLRVKAIDEEIAATK